ncbi:MAG: hypothetical protein QME65_06180, partial [Candidatus Omnitrophota bacterium]|nr:hypothetical protein [Candidatus Omnitrophota bacterium]
VKEERIKQLEEMKKAGFKDIRWWDSVFGRTGQLNKMLSEAGYVDAEHFRKTYNFKEQAAIFSRDDWRALAEELISKYQGKVDEDRLQRKQILAQLKEVEQSNDKFKKQKVEILNTQLEIIGLKKKKDAQGRLKQAQEELEKLQKQLSDNQLSDKKSNLKNELKELEKKPVVTLEEKIRLVALQVELKETELALAKEKKEQERLRKELGSLWEKQELLGLKQAKEEISKIALPNKKIEVGYTGSEVATIQKILGIWFNGNPMFQSEYLPLLMNFYLSAISGDYPDTYSGQLKNMVVLLQATLGLKTTGIWDREIQERSIKAIND